MKQFLLALWKMECHLRAHIALSRSISTIPVVGIYLSMVIDRLLLIVYGIDVDSKSIQVKALSIAHPVGVLLGGNGIVSAGRVVILSDVKFVGKSPDDPKYQERHRQGNVFSLGDNVVIGTGSTVLGPVTICDNVLIGAMSLINKDILESGVYAGIPVKKISNDVTDAWVRHL